MATPETYQPEYGPTAQPHLELVPPAPAETDVEPVQRTISEEGRRAILESYKQSARLKIMSAEQAVAAYNTWDPDNPMRVSDIYR